MKYLFHWVCLSICVQSFALLPIHAQIDAIKLNPIEGQWDSTTKPITIQSSDARTQQLSQYAFDMHGAFTVRESGGLYTLRLTPESETSIQLEILTGSPAVVQFAQSVSGANKDNAILRACDLAVRKITGDPGFFAGRITFISDRTGQREVYESDLFLQKVRRITNHKAQTVSPHLSPDGSKITYTSYFKSGFPDLFIYDSNTGRATTLASFKGTNTGGVFDPFGSRMILILSSSGNPEIYVGNASGKNLKRITDNRSIEASPSWSPDGTRIIFTSDQGGSPQLYEMSVEGGSATRIPTNISRYCAEPSWNPVHPELIVFTGSTAQGFQLALYNKKTREARWLTAGGGDNIEARWLNDGRHVIFTQRTSNSMRLHIMDVETGKISALHAMKFGNSSQGYFIYPR